MSVRPRIGITSGTARAWRPDGDSWRPYAAAVERAGGEPVHLDALALGREAEVLEGLEGILFSGGKDIDLEMFPNPPDVAQEDRAAVIERFHLRPEPERDAYELPLLQAALERDIPVLGICRGCQALNVALGGRLILDIAVETGSPLRHTSAAAPDGTSSHHALRVLPETQLAEILDPEHFRHCNSRHHQAVRVDETFAARVAAVSPEDGIIEAIESPAHRWAIGVQWHPEHPDDTEVRELYAPLFNAFVAAARRL